MKSSQIRFENFTQMLNMPIKNKRDGKHRRTLGCLDQYTYMLILLNSQDHETV